MTLYAMIGPATDVVVSAYGGAEGAGTSMGSVEDVTITSSGKTTFATHGAYYGAKVSAHESEPEVKVTLVCDNITAANLVQSLGGTASSNDIKRGHGGGAVTAKTVYIRGLSIGGDSKGLKVYKAVPVHDGEIAMGYDSTKVKVTFEALYDETQTSGEEYYTTYATASDTTPPTISAVSPGNSSASVDASVSTLVIWTFSESVKADDVTSEHFYVHNASGAVKSGSVAMYNASATQVAFTSASAWTASSTYSPCVIAGVRDLAGNKLAATSVTTFTTA